MLTQVDPLVRVQSAAYCGCDCAGRRPSEAAALTLTSAGHTYVSIYMTHIISRICVVHTHILSTLVYKYILPIMLVEVIVIDTPR